MIQVTVLGRLGADIEVRTTNTTNKRYARLRIAVNEGSNDKKTTTWFTAILNDETQIQSLQKYLTKGTAVIVTGRETCEIYQTKDGANAISRTIFAYNVSFPNIGGRQENSEVQSTATTAAPLPTAQQAAPQPQVVVTPKVETPTFASNIDIDDLPF